MCMRAYVYVCLYASGNTGFEFLRAVRTRSVQLEVASVWILLPGRQDGGREPLVRGNGAGFVGRIVGGQALGPLTIKNDSDQARLLC